MLTIFTPTYNREYTLQKLYESLKNQKEYNFEWLIVDDGSIDNTAGLVERFQNENLFKIRYHLQENKGKHIAINTGLQLAEGSYFLVIDSDDYFLDGALQILEKYIKELDQLENIAGFTFIRFMDDILFDPLNYGNKEWLGHQKYEWEFPGEMGYCFKTKIAKRFPFPYFEGEKFCTESLVYRRIEREYDILYTDNVLASGKYLDDGLSAKYSKLMENNPKGALLTFSERVQYSKNNYVLRKQYAKTYWDIAIKAKNITWFDKFKGIPFVLSLWYWKNRLLK